MEKASRKWVNFFLILILTGDLFMLVNWFLYNIGLSPISNYPPFLQLLGCLLVLASVSLSLYENNKKQPQKKPKIGAPIPFKI